MLISPSVKMTFLLVYGIDQLKLPPILKFPYVFLSSLQAELAGISKLVKVKLKLIHPMPFDIANKSTINGCYKSKPSLVRQNDNLSSNWMYVKMYVEMKFLYIALMRTKKTGIHCNTINQEIVIFKMLDL